MYTVEIMGHQYKTPSVLFASRVVQSVRDKATGADPYTVGLGSREMGSHFPICDANGVQVAYASYNGKIWGMGGLLISNAVAAQ